MLRKTLSLMGLIIAVGALAAVAADITASHPIAGTFPSAGEQTVLYSQISNPSGGGAAAQDFEAIYDIYDCYVADDFVVTWADGWSIEQLHTPGIYSTTPPGGPAMGIVYEVFGNSGGIPGISLCSGTASIVSDVAGDIVSQLPAACDLTVPETYWVSVAARMDYLPNGQWYVAAEAATIGNIARWYNPGNGFGNGCTTWSSCDISVINASYQDMSFEVLGSEIPVELQSLGVE